MSATTTGPMVEVLGVHKNFGKTKVLKGVDLQVGVGEVMCIVGPSGSGKSTLLRTINRLEMPDRGLVLVGGEIIGYELYGDRLRERKECDIARQRSKIGMVFQQFNLFGNRTALENVMLGPLRTGCANRAAAEDEARRLLIHVGLEHRLRFDVAVDGISDTRARQKVVNFVDYANAGQVILAPTAKAGGVTNLLDICGHSLAYAAGTFGQQLANDVTTLCAKAHKPVPSQTAFPDAPSIQLALESGRISLELESTATAGYDAKVSKGRISAIVVPSSQAMGDFASSLEGVVVPKGEPQLAKAIQDALTRMLQDGTYMSILRTWGVRGLAVKKITYDTPSF